jgi:hypothetical protein
MINIELPDDCQSYLREYQGDAKSKKDVGFYSLQKCIIAIIREHRDFTKTGKQKRPDDPEQTAEEV